MATEVATSGSDEPTSGAVISQSLTAHCLSRQRISSINSIRPPL